MFYYVINVKENGKYYAYAEKMSKSDNLVSFVERHKTADVIMPVKTFKYAKEIAAAWNEAYKKNGTSMF